jgi:hypothetical protein
LAIGLRPKTKKKKNLAGTFSIQYPEEVNGHLGLPSYVFFSNGKKRKRKLRAERRISLSKWNE